MNWTRNRGCSKLGLEWKGPRPKRGMAGEKALGYIQVSQAPERQRVGTGGAVEASRYVARLRQPLKVPEVGRAASPSNHKHRVPRTLQQLSKDSPKSHRPGARKIFLVTTIAGQAGLPVANRELSQILPLGEPAHILEEILRGCG